MRLERSFIAIRQRTVLELLDLALPVLRIHSWNLLAVALVGIAPFAIFNAIVLRWMLLDYNFDVYRPLYGWVMMLLVINQAPAATTMVSHYLGQVMFIERPSVRDTVATVSRRWMPLCWLHGVIGQIAPVVCLSIVLWQSEVVETVVVFLVMAVLLGVLIRGLRPFVSEVITLEQTPWNKRGNLSKLSFSARSHMLHSTAAADHLGGMFIRGWFAGLMSLAIYCAGYWTAENLGLGLDSPEWSVSVIWPMALWTTAMFFGVVRFLAYINARINQEGWDVEIKVRAEAQKLLNLNK